MKMEIPPYIKNILEWCGYQNCHTISTIEENDIQYFENEVRKGNVKNFFHHITTEDVLDVSYKWNKSAENFEFSRGHRNLIITIAKLVKKNLNEKGVFSLSEPKPMSKQRKRAVKNVNVPLDVPTKFIKLSKNEQSQDCLPENSERVHLKAHKSTLLRKMILSLITHTPEMFADNYEVMTSEKTLSDFIHLETISSENTSVLYAADINCPYCSKPLCVSHSSPSSDNNGKKWWNMSNFDRHLKDHVDFFMSEDEKDLKKTRSFRVKKYLKKPGVKVDSLSTCKTLGIMLQTFVDSAERNFDRKKQGYRFDLLTKMFSVYIFLLCGLLAYETLNANFPLSIPSVSTVRRFLKDNGPNVIEGKMRTEELLEYLKSKNLPLKVSISEDATRITAKISYDPVTNQLIGFALPLDETGMPITFSFPARNASEIQKHFSNSSNFISSSVYVQMAQPLEPNTPPFCLLIYLTDNSFTANNTLKRWQFQAEKLKEKEITIENIATDGDSRPLKVMKYLSKLGQSDQLFFDCEFFSCGGAVETTCSQDATHIITKARNTVLKCSRIFPIGDKVISSSHLKYLIENVSKDKHLLTRTDIEPKDRQNFLSAQKICSENTTQCLLKYVPGCEGTVIFLNAMRNVVTAFMDYDINSADRIFFMWYPVFFVRGWRSWLLNSEKKDGNEKNSKRIYNLKENFISSNLYTCIELNAHTLVKKVLVEDEDTSRDDRNQIFFPNIFSSQPCESMFRQARSFTSTFLTQVNFNMLDIIHKIKRIQLQSDIITTSNSKIKFPRFEKKMASAEDSPEQFRFEGLNRAAINFEIERARKAVISDLEKIGINTSTLNFHCQVKPIFEKDMKEDNNDIDSDLDSDSEDFDVPSGSIAECKDLGMNEIESLDGELEDLQKDLDALSGITGEELLLKDYSKEYSMKKIHLDEESPFAVVVDKKGKEIVVRKSSICWLLSKNKYKLSSDRLQRVQEKEYSENIAGKNEILNIDSYTVCDQISIGDWCIFSQKEYDCFFEERENEESLNVLFGMVLGFTYLDGQNFKQREFSKTSATVPAHPIVNSERDVGVLCSLYTSNFDGLLKNVHGCKHKFINIKTYIGTIEPPIYDEQKLYISSGLVDIIVESN